eukprot:4833837-Amphidinium_carterae.1
MAKVKVVGKTPCCSCYVCIPIEEPCHRLNPCSFYADVHQYTMEVLLRSVVRVAASHATSIQPS